MKGILCLLLISTVVAGCGVRELRNEDVAKMIRKKLKFPQTFSYEINKADAGSAKNLMTAGLEAEGFVSIKKILTLDEIGKPIIQFTEKSEPFLLPTPAGKSADKVQVVKVADIEFDEVTFLRLETQFNFARVKYTLVYKNITPFAVLIKKDLTKPELRHAVLTKHSTGWVLEE
ncbi:MAG: hypothetical protein ACTHLE_09630 [Agriterribacter sp.]